MAVERALKIREEKRDHVKYNNLAKEDKMKPKKQQMSLNSIKYTNEINDLCVKKFYKYSLSLHRQQFEMKKVMDTRLVLAEKRKESVEIGRKMIKMQKEIDHFVKHFAFRQESLGQNTLLYEMYVQERRKNVEV